MLNKYRPTLSLPFITAVSEAYKSWILEYGNILYSGANSTHLHPLDVYNLVLKGLAQLLSPPLSSIKMLLLWD